MVSNKLNNIEIDSGVKEYFNGIKSFSPLTKKEERKLLRRYRKKGDLIARNRIIEANLKYACSLANSYRGRGISFSDLISEANSGLIEAVDKFDLKQDVKFCTYAKWWILQRIKLNLQNKGKMPLSELPTERDKQIPDDAIDAPINYKENDNIIDSVDEDVVETDKKKFLDELLNILPEKEQDMIRLYYGINNKEHNLDLISQKYGISGERVRQIIEKSMTKIRSAAILVNNQWN